MNLLLDPMEGNEQEQNVEFKAIFLMSASGTDTEQGSTLCSLLLAPVHFIPFT